MKNLYLSLLFVSLCGWAYCQTSKGNQPLKPTIQISDTIHDFGNIIETNGKVSWTFDVSNKGQAALLISEVHGSCGCAASEWSKSPIIPGEKGFVTVTFNPENRPGAFFKTFTLNNNSDKNPVLLYIKGNVIREGNK
jgi:hypothetical protein